MSGAYSPMPDDAQDEDPTRGVCGAKTRSGGICTQKGMANGRCHLHGGKSKSGVKAGAFRHGRYSKAVKALASDIDDRVNDPALLDPRRSLAVQEGVLAKLAELEARDDSPNFRERVRADLRAGLDLIREDPRAGLQAIQAVMRLVERGAEQTRALAGVGAAAEALGRGQERYWKTAMSSARAIAPDEFIGLMFRMADIIEKEVDRDAARRILERTDREICGGALGLAGGD